MLIWRRLDRLFRHSLGFAIVTLLILAISIGANTAVFSIINGVVLRPISYSDPNRLFAIQEGGSRFKHPTIPVSAYDFKQWRDHTHSFEELALIDTVMMSLTNEGEPQRLSVSRVSADYFVMLGIQPNIGRNFRPEEDLAGQDRVVILSNALWRTRFQSDPRIIGRTLTLDDVPYEVVGVMPPDFPALRASQLRPLGPQDIAPDMWRPFAITDAEAHAFGDWNYAAVAKLKPGISVAEARSDINAVQTSIAQGIGGNWNLRAVLIPLHEQITGKVRQGLMMLFIAVFAVLLIGCANIANLVLVRASNRRREVAIQTALGATTHRLVKEAISEGILLATLGGIAGLIVAYLALKLLVLNASVELPRIEEVRLDWHVLVFTILISAFAGILFGLLPVWRTSGVDVQESLKSSGHSVLGGGKGQRLRSILVGLEVSLTAACLMAAGLLLHSFSSLMHVDEGFNGVRVATVELSLPKTRYADRPQRSDFIEHTLDRLKAIPGVQSAAVSSLLPLTGEGDNNILTVDGTNVPRIERPIAEFRSASPDFFKTLGIPLKDGRIFTEADKSHDVVVISDKVANRLFPGQNALGRKIHLGDETRPPLEIIGVVGDVRGGSLEKPPDMTIYLPYWQRVGFDIFLAAKTNMGKDAVGWSMSRSVQAVDKELPVPPARTMEDVVNISTAQRRFQMNLIVIFAGIAILLTGVGIYSVVSYATSQRINEVGVRFALGATKGNVIWLIVRQGMFPIGIGLLAGLGGALALGRMMQAFLFGVVAHDPVTLTAVILLLAAIGALACYMPARRAAAMDPLRALRYE